jgi:hypothetical protein
LWTDLTDGGYLSVVGMIVEMRKKNKLKDTIQWSKERLQYDKQ